MAKVVCIDFDDTIVLDNIARGVFERFASPAWREAEAEYHAGALSVEQFNARALALIEAPRDELVAFARAAARVREGFVHCIEWCQANGWQPVVLSNGFDFYVDPVLDDLGLDRIGRHRGRTRQDYRWTVRYLSPRGVDLADGFKLAYVQAFRAAGDFVAYVGDGASDVAAARLADFVIARSTLLATLQEEGREVHPFETFDDVVAVLADYSGRLRQ